MRNASRQAAARAGLARAGLGRAGPVPAPGWPRHPLQSETQEPRSPPRDASPESRGPAKRKRRRVLSFRTSDGSQGAAA